MDNTFSLKQISRTSKLDANLITRHNELNLMADFLRIKYENPTMEQSEIAEQLNYSTSTLQRYRNDINMFLPYRHQPNITIKRTKETSNTNFDNSSHREPDGMGPRMTSFDLKQVQKNLLLKLNLLKLKTN